MMTTLLVGSPFLLALLWAWGLAAGAADARRRADPPGGGSRAAAIAALLLVPAAAAAAAGCEPAAPPPAAPAPNEIHAAIAAGDLAHLDPDAAAWSTASEFTVPMLPQDVTEPKLVEPGVAALRVRAVASASWIVFRLAWADPTVDDRIGVEQFSDAVAVETPVAAGGDVPSAQMGQAGRPVAIHLWKAAWQTQAGGPQQTLADLYPNALIDHYPPEAAPPASREEMETRYAPARSAGNPVTLGTSPVADFVAEGFGTLTALPQSTSTGGGVHGGDGWRVTIGVPMGTAADQALFPGHRTYVAFAVWDGARDEVGARKMRSNWIVLRIDPIGGGQ